MLSFLSTRDAVRTCVLAKRWRDIWASVPVLKFDLKEFLTNCHDKSDYSEWTLYEIEFEQFVNGVLEHREPSVPLDVFNYEWKIAKSNYSEASMEWFDRVALLSPRVINALTNRENVLDVPGLVFSCARLEELNLSLYTD